MPGRKRIIRKNADGSRRRAPSGAGSITQRADGRWVGKISLGYDDMGRRLRPAVVADTPEQVASALEELRRTTPTAQRERPESVGALFERWLPIVKSQKTDAMYAWYEGTYRIHIKDDPIAKTQLRRLTALELDDFYLRKANAKVGGRTREKIHVTMHAALAVAVGWQLVPMNAADYAQRPTYRAPKAPPFAGAQIDKLLAAIAGDRYEAIYLLALFCGLREGEIFGLYRSDFDLAAGTVAVNRIVSEVSGSPVVQARTKTRGSAKTVLMPQIVAAAVRAHFKRTMAKGDADFIVFTAPESGLIRRSNFLRREYFPMLEKARLPRKRFHLLRKALGTWLAFKGVHAKAAQAMLRHDRASTTLEFYTDDAAMQAVAVAAIDEAYPRTKEL